MIIKYILFIGQKISWLVSWWGPGSQAAAFNGSLISSKQSELLHSSPALIMQSCWQALNMPSTTVKLSHNSFKTLKFLTFEVCWVF